MLRFNLVDCLNFYWNMDLEYYDSEFLFIVNEDCEIWLCKFLWIEEFLFDIFN